MNRCESFRYMKIPFEIKNKHSEIRWAIRIGKKDPYFALSQDSLGPQLYDLRKDALAAKGRGVAVKVLVKEI